MVVFVVFFTLKVSVMKVERVDLSQDGLPACIYGVASGPSCLIFAHFPRIFDF